MLFYQSTLGDRLEYELTFNDYSRVIQATGDADASYDIENVSLEQTCYRLHTNVFDYNYNYFVIS